MGRAWPSAEVGQRRHRDQNIRSVAAKLTERRGERLPEVRQDDLPSLHTLAAGIDRDRDALARMINRL
jgi:hypothetical protein